jgi:predicted metal-dependent hydrolase
MADSDTAQPPACTPATHAGGHGDVRADSSADSSADRRANTCVEPHVDTHHAARAEAPTTITVREGLDFDLAGAIPRHWFGGDAFKTRFFDAMSTLFPEGERFFIACVRDFKDQLHTPEQRQACLDFARQEAQHSKVHMAFNHRLAAQGVKVDRIMANQRRHLFDGARQRLSKAHTLAITAASEHLTALMADGFVARTDQFRHADPRIRAMYVWHAIEEVEHKGVAFDLMQQVAHVGYGLRVWALIVVSIQFPLFAFQILNHMLKVDGFTRRQRWALWLKGLYWLYGPGGLMGPLLKPYLAWFKPGFHPWQSGQRASFEAWSRALADSGDPIAASNALYGRSG